MRNCWVITDGNAGMVNQALGLSETLGLDVTVKTINLRYPWRALTPYLRLGKAYCLHTSSDQVTPPYPDLVIATGRQSILPALAVKSGSKGKTKVIYIQDPVINPSHFDAVIVPKHDELSGKNVIQLIGAPHRLTHEKLAKEAKKFKETLRPVKDKTIAVLLGGPNKCYKMDSQTVAKLTNELEDLISKGYRLLISPSRRTPREAVEHLHARLADKAYIWDMTGENPYFALLGSADYILVTCDSVCMVSESSFTPCPVYMIPLPGGNQKFEQFHNNIIGIGRVRWWTGEIDSFPVIPLDENKNLASKVQQVLFPV